MADEKTRYVSLTELENDTEPIEGLLSPFEIDLNVLVKVNHELTIESICKREQRWIAETREQFEDQDEVESRITDEEVFCDDLRRAANNLATVGLVTRFQHRIGALVKEVGGKPSYLHKELQQLNEALGNGPVPLNFFEELDTARDSVIHGDSKAAWRDSRNGQLREIAEHHRSFAGQLAELEISEVQLNEAIENAIKQVEWYIERLAEKKVLAKKDHTT
jgi:hypothetical protein